MPRNVRLMWTGCMTMTAPWLDDVAILGTCLNITVALLIISVVAFR
jgi:hypothetical protein